MAEIGFYHGALSDEYEEQANAQGYTLGDKAEYFKQIKYAQNMLRIHGFLTDSQCDYVVKKIQKALVNALSRLPKTESEINTDET